MECDTAELIPYIEKLEKELVIYKIANDNYVYEKGNNTKFKRTLNSKVIKVETTYSPTENQIFNLNKYKQFPAEQVLTNKQDLDYFNKSTEEMKQILVKHIVLFNLIGDLGQTESQSIIDKIAIDYPEYKMNAQWYRTKYKRYIKDGLAGLYLNRKSAIDETSYTLFKELYLSPKQYTQGQAYEILRMKGYADDSMPKAASFMKKLKQEYSAEEIKQFRTPAEKDVSESAHLKTKPRNILFKDAVNYYWKMIEDNEINTCGVNKYNQIKRLKQYFKGYKLADITQEEIIKYRKQLMTEGVCFSTIKVILGTLLLILRMCGYHQDYDIYENLTKSVDFYTLDEIKTIVETDGPEAWVILLGLKLTELKALEYGDINLKKEILTVSKFYRDDKVVHIQHKNQMRKIKIPKLLLNRIDRNKTGVIFGQITMPNYESCLYAHITLLLAQNVPMNLIAKDMGYESVYTFYRQFHNIFPQKMDDDFDITKPLGIA